MKTRKEKRSIKSANDHGLRKKVTSPKLDILRPSNQMNEKKYIKESIGDQEKHNDKRKKKYSDRAKFKK